MPSLFEELEDQLTQAINNLKHLNEVITSTSAALSTATKAATDTTATDTTATDTTATDTTVVNTSPETQNQHPPPKKRATRKKATRKKAKVELVEEVTPGPSNDPIPQDVPLDPLGNPIQPNDQHDPFADYEIPITGVDEVIDIATVRSKLQEVAVKLDGQTQRIAEAMQTGFNKKKLSEFTPDEYPKLIQIIEALVTPDLDDPLF